MEQLSMQNLPEDFYPAKKTLKQVEAGNQQTILQNPKSQNSTFFSEQMTILQMVSPHSKAGNQQTILQNPKSQNYIPSAVSSNDISLPQTSEVVQQSGSSFQPTQTIKATERMQNIARFSTEDDLRNINAADLTVVQSHNNPIIQHSNPVVQNLTGQTIIQYSDSAIHNPAEHTVCQAISPSSTNLDRKLIQSKKPKFSDSLKLTKMPKNRRFQIRLSYSSIRNVFRRLSSFSWQFTDIKRRLFYSIWRNIRRQLQSLFHKGRQPTMSKFSKQPPSSSPNYHTHHTHDAIASAEQPSLEEYQKKLRELDLCRLCFAKELAKNGKFRSAIFEAEQISETSYYFKDARMLIQSWK